MDEEIRLQIGHLLPDRHAADGWIDAPALPYHIAAPDEADIAPRRRRGTETAHHGLADALHIREVLETHVAENILARRQTAQSKPRGEIGILQSSRADLTPAILETLRRGVIDDHAGRPIRPRPDNATVIADIAALHAMGHKRPA